MTNMLTKRGNSDTEKHTQGKRHVKVREKLG